MKERSAEQQQSVLAFLRRSFVVAMLVLSLLSALIPLSAASSSNSCTMECCAGTAPHEAGACSTGLLKAASPLSEDNEVLCGLHTAGYPTATRLVPWEVIASNTDAGDSDHAGSCGSHHADNSKHRTSSEPAKSKSSRAATIAAPSMTTPCNSDCGACSGVYVRKPRPREQAPAAWAGHARPPSTAHFLRGFFSQTATLRGHYDQPQPRGPPTLLS